MLKGQRRDVSGQVVVGVLGHFIKIDGDRKKGGAPGWRSSYGEGHDPEEKWVGSHRRALSMDGRHSQGHLAALHDHPPSMHTVIKKMSPVTELCRLRF